LREGKKKKKKKESKDEEGNEWTGQEDRDKRVDG
jgi:hypothetical protein